MSGLQSILKNYMEHEQLHTDISLSLTNMAMIKTLGKYQVQGSNIGRDFTSYLSDLHIDYDNEESKEDPVIYDIAVSNIIELRDYTKVVNMDMYEFGKILQDAVTHIPEDCVLYVLWVNYNKHIAKKHVKVYQSFIFYLKDIILDNEHRLAIKEQISTIVDGMDEETTGRYWTDLMDIHDFFTNQETLDSSLDIRYLLIIYDLLTMFYFSNNFFNNM